MKYLFIIGLWVYEIKSMLRSVKALPTQELEQELKDMTFTETVVCPYFSTGALEFRLVSLGHRVIAADKNVYRVNFWQCMKQGPRRVWDQVERLQVRSMANVRKLRRDLRSGAFADKFQRAAAYLVQDHISCRAHLFRWTQTGKQQLRDQVLRFQWPENIQLYYGDSLSLLQRFPKMSAFVHLPKKQLGNIHLLGQVLNAPGRRYMIVAPDEAVIRTTFRDQTLKFLGNSDDTRILVTNS